MISHIQGTLFDTDDEGVILEINGIGLKLLISETTRHKLPPLAESCFLHTHLSVREDALTLFGFSTPQEKTLFEALISVSGIGPRGAIKILSKISPPDFHHAVLSENQELLTAIPGIGKKTASRLIIELREKISAIEITDSTSVLPIQKTLLPYREAEEALVSLGYPRKNASRIIQSVKENSELQEAPLEEIIRASLKMLRENKS